MNEFATALREREPVVGTWLSIGHPAVAEVCAGGDLDFAVVDTEHAPTGMETVENMVRAIEAAPGNTAALARVADNDPVRIKRMLDTGVAGVVVPMVDTAEQARAAVRAMQYPPGGIRGVAAGRASDYGRRFAEYVDRANDDLLTVVQIETETGVENAADIAAVEGVDALFVGPADLSTAIGTFPDWHSDAVVDAVKTVLEAGRTAAIPVGTLAADADETDVWLDRGMDFLAVGFDAGFLSAAVDDATTTFRNATESR